MYTNTKRKIDKHLKLSLFILVIIVLLESCGSIAKIPVNALFLGQRVNTTVDSEIARYYLESYQQKISTNPQLDKEIALLHEQYQQLLPSRKQLQEISQAYSVDFAALFLADRLLSHDCNKKLNKAFAYYLQSSTLADVNNSAYRLLFVPGWNYRENGHLTGADFKNPRWLATQYGFDNYLVEIPPTGSVEENAAYLATEITRHNQSGKKLILVGASSAGPAIHLTLAELLKEKDRKSIKAWINLGGILQGTPVIDYYQTMPRRWLFNLAVWHKDWDKEAVSSMNTKHSRIRSARLIIESDLLIINYMGVPLSGQLSQYSKDKYPLIKSEGPNDGLTLLTDIIAPNSLTIIALGSDHFFAEDPEINKKTVALMQLITNYLEKDRSKGCKGYI